MTTPPSSPRSTRGQVRSVSVGPDGALDGRLKDGTHFTSGVPTALGDTGLAKRLQDKRVQVKAVGPTTSVWSVVVSLLLPLAVFAGFFLWMGRSAKGQLASDLGAVGRSRTKVFDAERPSTTFAEVAGYEGVKREVTEVVDFLCNPDRYRRAGAMGPKGVLMVGPPGTGKTLIARAVAGEAGVPFLSVTGSSFVEMFVGVGAARVRDLFADARKRAPSIVFIDEIDAIGQRRGGQVISNDERDQTLNQMLSEMDGFDPATGVVVIAATNRPEVLDPALLRPGRFDRQVVIPLPTQRERRAILAVHARGKPLGGDVGLGVVARGTPGFSGADLANLVNEAAIYAVRAGRDVIQAVDFSEARDRVLLGRRESSNALLPDEKRAVAVHESGHALVAALSKHGDPVAKVAILPAGQALGATEQLPVDERHLYSEGYLKDSLGIRMGGRAGAATRRGGVRRLDRRLHVGPAAAVPAARSSPAPPGAASWPWRSARVWSRPTSGSPWSPDRCVAFRWWVESLRKEAQNAPRGSTQDRTGRRRCRVRCGAQAGAPTHVERARRGRTALPRAPGAWMVEGGRTGDRGGGALPGLRRNLRVGLDQPGADVEAGLAGSVLRAGDAGEPATAVSRVSTLPPWIRVWGSDRRPWRRGSVRPATARPHAGC
jgi:ATP-dependent metalloprotease FtsH